MAILGISLRRTEDSALFGAAKAGSVAVTLQLFQQVTVKHNHHSTHAITWSESLSVSGGSKRPKKILEVLDKLVDMFVEDFLVAQSGKKMRMFVTPPFPIQQRKNEQVIGQLFNSFSVFHSTGTSHEASRSLSLFPE